MPKQIKKLLALPILTLMGVYIPVYAAVSQEGWNPDALKVTKLPDRPVSEIMVTFINWAIVIIGLICICVFIYAGFLYLTAQGETDKLETAKKVMIYAVVGVVVSILGYVVVKTVNDVLVGDGSSSGGSQSTAPASGPPPSSTSPDTSAPPGSSAPPAPMPVAPGMTGN